MGFILNITGCLFSLTPMAFAQLPRRIELGHNGSGNPPLPQRCPKSEEEEEGLLRGPEETTKDWARISAFA